MSEIGSTIPYGEAWLLLLELRRESGSHIHMVRHSFTETSSLAEYAAISHAEWYMSVHRAKDTPPVELPHPWVVPDPNSDVTPEQRADLEARFNAMSAFPDT